MGFSKGDTRSLDYGSYGGRQTVILQGKGRLKGL